jgi:hypothetical protein
MSSFIYTSQLGNIKNGPLLGPFQASANTIKNILDTINNLVQILKLIITLNLPPASFPPPKEPTLTVILPKVTTLGSGLD